MTSLNLTSFEANGFALIDDWLSDAEVESMTQRAYEIVREAALSERDRQVFATGGSDIRDSRFLNTGTEVAVFWEPHTVFVGSLDRPPIEAANKIGHALHDLEPIFDRVSRSPRVRQLCSDLSIVDPLLVQSQFIFKAARIGGAVAPHNDHTYLWTEPPATYALWMALDDADEMNGCLHVLAGGHRLAQGARYMRDDRMRTTLKVWGPPYRQCDFEPLPVQKGSLIVMDGRLPHFSAANRSERTRHAYVLNLIDGRSKWPSDNWLVRPSDFPFRGL